MGRSVTQGRRTERKTRCNVRMIGTNRTCASKFPVCFPVYAQCTMQYLLFSAHTRDTPIYSHTRFATFMAHKTQVSGLYNVIS